MGAIGVYVLNLFLGFFHTIKGLVNYIKWHKKFSTNGTIKRLKDKNYKYDDTNNSITFSHVEYTYDLEVIKDGVPYTVEYIEYSGDRDGDAKFKPNDIIYVYVDFNKNEAVCKAFLRNQLLYGPALCSFSIVLLFICFIIYILLSNLFR